MHSQITLAHTRSTVVTLITSGTTNTELLQSNYTNSCAVVQVKLVVFIFVFYTVSYCSVCSANQQECYTLDAHNKGSPVATMDHMLLWSRIMPEPNCFDLIYKIYKYCNNYGFYMFTLFYT